MQIYADVTGYEYKVIRSDQGPAVGSAMHAAVAAGPPRENPGAGAEKGAAPG